ncbi:MAG: DUF1415 domain-containing protein [Polycyclovorans sp.]|jgi:hypothetical protein|nr:hypothetical protein [Polycyclovorans sp.]MDP1543715.1 DUF1415 domain-containing protein [Polycyclovorans sp.]|tara:strand:- start:7071 stop:7616 length:546 start_codon:yes stop_codon:yes gene_type:complete
MQGVEQAVRHWLESVVVGLNLCPFAAATVREQRLRIVVSRAEEPVALLDDVQDEINRLDDRPATELDTTLIAIPRMLSRFDAYLDVLDEVERLLKRQGRIGVYQVASFHPAYRFDGLPPDDPSHLTNRAPVPLIHLLREASVAAAVARHPDAHGIPDANIARMRALTGAQRRALFGALADD